MVLLAVLGAPCGVEAAGVDKAPRIGFISSTSPGTAPAIEAFIQGLRDLGYFEGQNITIEWRWGCGRTERFPEFVADLVDLKVDVIVTANDAAGYAAQAATRDLVAWISRWTQ
jgi:putative ABC transport system substrate-binding protein